MSPSQPVHASLVDFVNGTWDHSASGGSSSSTGWQAGQTSGSTVVNGVTITLESIQAGSSAASGGNLSFSAIGATTGFRFGNDGTSDINTGATLTNYQEWRFTFSEAVEGLTWDVYDLDTRNNSTGWRDAIAAETWDGPVGVLGDGTGVNWNLGGSELALRSTFELDHVSRDTDQFGFDNVATEDAAGRAGLSTNGRLTVLSLYLFNDLNPNGNHNVVNDGTFSFTVSTPEPSSLVLTACLAFGGVFRRKRQIA